MGDVCIVCCDGLTGLPDAIGVVWPQAIVQLCVVHLIRASLRYASRRYWVPLSKDLRPIYTAPDEAAAAAALEEFAAAWGERYPAIVKVWRAHWEEFTPFLAFPPEVRRVIYTTNLIESMNARLRKVTRNRGQFPSEQAALKVLYLAVRNLQDYRTRTPGSGAPGGNRPCRRSRSTSKDESRPHDRHDHLHRRSDAPSRPIGALRDYGFGTAAIWSGAWRGHLPVCRADPVEGHGQGGGEDRGPDRDERDLPAGHAPGDDGMHPGRRVHRKRRAGDRGIGVGEGGGGPGEDHQNTGRQGAQDGSDTAEVVAVVDAVHGPSSASCHDLDGAGAAG